MQSTDASKVLSKHLLTVLDLFGKADEVITGPKGDTYHHFQEVHIIRGDDAYHITNVVGVTDTSLTTHALNLHTHAARFRGMSGVCIVFWSEERYLWSRSLFFHKGQVYVEDHILQENAEIDTN